MNKAFFRAAMISMWMTSSAFAQDDELRAILKARTSAQLSRGSAVNQTKTKLKLSCDAQLRSSRVPVSCFKWISATNDDGAELRDHRNWLAQLCEKRARTSLDRSELETVETDPNIPLLCRKAAEVRAADLDYIAAGNAPQNFFHKRSLNLNLRSLE